ncbi:MAG: winged helix-turn-helix transcriptional regulator [Candidatus Magasanikbacteria bacterium]|nr:winged helix-turn-helix transcriptional regulator [Candidatus Magasanikbacteria bacterium]
MKTDTKQKILAYIKENKRVSAKEIIGHFGLNATGIFRHLGSLIKQGLIIKQGKPPTVFYLPTNDKKQISSIIQNGFIWNEHRTGILPLSEVYCPTRDVFQARLDRLLADCLHQFDENLSYLLTAVVGEIGNNSFDHNLGNWRDVAGIYFAADLSSREILIADRGQGVFATIKRVRPKIKNDIEAVRIAFTERISGRAPEQRGNGLKFVKKIFEQQGWQLIFNSGQASCRIESGAVSFVHDKKNIRGIIALIKF